jgi:hypothetical protein
MDLCGSTEKPDLLSCDGDFLPPEAIFPLYIAGMEFSHLPDDAVHISMYLGLVERMAVWCSWMQHLKLILCCHS